MPRRSRPLLAFSFLFTSLSARAKRPGRIQIAGFRTVVPWIKLTWPKKAFVVLCAAFAGTAVLFGIMIISNFYVDSQVPVTLSPFASVIKTGDDLVTATGTWTRFGSGPGSGIANPVQTSRIECNKTERRRTEARAAVDGNLLTANAWAACVVFCCSKSGVPLHPGWRTDRLQGSARAVQVPPVSSAPKSEPSLASASAAGRPHTSARCSPETQKPVAKFS